MIMTEYNSFNPFEMVFNIRSKGKLFSILQLMCQIKNRVSQNPRLRGTVYHGDYLYLFGQWGWEFL